jgi:hypothetical protein
MITEIKTIVKNYLNNAMLCSLMTGTVTADGIQVSEKLTIPLDLVTGNQKASIVVGDKVRMLRNHGGQQYYILEVIS